MKIELNEVYLDNQNFMRNFMRRNLKETDYASHSIPRETSKQEDGRERHPRSGVCQGSHASINYWLHHRPGPLGWREGEAEKLQE